MLRPHAGSRRPAQRACGDRTMISNPTEYEKAREELRALEERLEQKVLRLVDNMPTMPDTATRAMALLDDRDVKFADLAALIERDAAIATGLLRVANSVLFAGGAPALKLDQAVVRLGTWQCKN